MEFLGRAKRAEYVPQLDASGNLAVKLLRTYTAQVEALAKLRRGGEQTVRVEHVHVHSGGQAIVGSVTPGGGTTLKSEDQPYALGYATGTALPRPNSARDALPVARDEERPLPDARRPTQGAPRGNKNAYKHGRYSAEAIARRREVSALIRAARAWLRDL